MGFTQEIITDKNKMKPFIDSAIKSVSKSTFKKLMLVNGTVYNSETEYGLFVSATKDKQGKVETNFYLLYSVDKDVEDYVKTCMSPSFRNVITLNELNDLISENKIKKVFYRVRTIKICEE
jgi:hypothetical protein